MLHFSLTLANPFAKEGFANLFNRDYALFGHKYCEFEILQSKGMLVSFGFSLHPRSDHGGANIEIGLMSYSVNVSIYDDRHWSYTTNSWV